MKRFTSFFAGVVVGAIGLYLVMSYHIVRANDGIHLVPKIAAKLDQPYYDIRNYTIQDWQQNQSLALALLKANKGDVMKDASLDGFKRSAQNLLDQFMGK
jgi:hypothetical protein